MIFAACKICKIKLREIMKNNPLTVNFIFINICVRSLGMSAPRRVRERDAKLVR